MNFRKLAQKVTTMSELMTGREKIDLDDIISNYKKGITITAFDMVLNTDDNKEYCVCTYKEDVNKFFFGGTILTNIFDSAIKEYGDIEKANEELAKEGGLTVKLSRSKTKANRDVTLVEIL